MTLNRRNLDRLRQLIKRHPHQINMREFIAPAETLYGADLVRWLDAKRRHGLIGTGGHFICGTHACIAGWCAFLHYRDTKQTRVLYGPIGDLAARFLGISKYHETRSALFYEWNNPHSADEVTAKLRALGRVDKLGDKVTAGLIRDAMGDVSW